MYGRSVTAHPVTRAADPAAFDLRRRVALAVARRFGGAGPATMFSVPPTPAQKVEPDADVIALDQRVRETGEW